MEYPTINEDVYNISPGKKWWFSSIAMLGFGDVDVYTEMSSHWVELIVNLTAILSDEVRNMMFGRFLGCTPEIEHSIEVPNFFQ